MSQIGLKEYCSNIDDLFSSLMKRLSTIIWDIIAINISWITLCFIGYLVFGGYQDIYATSLLSLFIISIIYFLCRILIEFNIKSILVNFREESEYDPHHIVYFTGTAVAIQNIKSTVYILLGLITPPIWVSILDYLPIESILNYLSSAKESLSDTFLSILAEYLDSLIFISLRDLVEITRAEFLVFELPILLMTLIGFYGVVHLRLFSVENPEKNNVGVLRLFLYTLASIFYAIYYEVRFGDAIGKLSIMLLLLFVLCYIVLAISYSVT